MTTDLSRKVVLHYSLRESLLSDIISQTNMMLFGQIVSLLFVVQTEYMCSCCYSIGGASNGLG